MRIWLVNHYALPPNIPGITRHYELASEWANEEGAEVTLWMSKFIHPRRSFVSQEEQNIPNSRVRMKWLWSFPHQQNDWKRILNMGSFAVNFFFQGLFQPRPDVLIASSPHLFAAFAGWMIAKIKRCPFVFEVRDLWPDSLIKMGGLRQKQVISLLTWMERFLYKKADQIVVLTAYQRKYIAEKGIPLNKIELIPNGVVVEEHASVSEAAYSQREIYREKMGLGSNTYVAIYTGAHGPANALESVVQAGKYLAPDMAIVLIGDGPEKEKLVRLKEKEKLKSIHFMDPVTKTEIFRYMQAADCGIISLADNDVFRGARPNKLFDYAFIGLPIISMVDGEVREIVEENRMGSFAGAENPEGLARAMDEMRALSEEEKQKMKENGREFIEREGNRKKLAHRFYEKLKQLLQGDRV